MHTPRCGGECAWYLVPIDDIRVSVSALPATAVLLRESSAEDAQIDRVPLFRTKEQRVVRECPSCCDGGNITIAHSNDDKNSVEKDRTVLSASSLLFYYHSGMRYGNNFSSCVNGSDGRLLTFVHDTRKSYQRRSYSRLSGLGPKRGFDNRRSRLSADSDSIGINNKVRSKITAAKYRVVCSCQPAANCRNAPLPQTLQFGMMMNGNLHLLNEDNRHSAVADVRHVVAMETADCTTVNGQQRSTRGEIPAVVNREQQQMLEQLNVLSLSERRLGFAASKNGTSSSTTTPRITLTSVDDDDEIDDGGTCSRRSCAEEMMIDSSGDPYGLDDHGPLSPNFLAVPKLQEVGKERRPPVMVKSM